MKLAIPKKPRAGGPLWTNHDLVLYHGTLKKHLGSIRSGIDLAKCDDDADFGRGFYTTTSYSQAVHFANNKVFYEGGRAALIEFIVPRDLLAPLDSLWFVRADVGADDYWKLVTACRKLGESNRGDEDVYDIVIGPVAKRYQNRRAYQGYDQVSFHTDKAIRVLDNRVTGMRDWQ